MRRESRKSNIAENGALEEATDLKSQENRQEQKRDFWDNPELVDVIRKKSIEKLIGIGILQKTESDEYIFDKKKLKEINLKRVLGFKYSVNKKQVNISSQEALISFLSELSAYDKDEYESRLADPSVVLEKRRIFYTPSDSLNMEEIKNDNSIISLSNLKMTAWKHLNDFYSRRFGFSAEESELAYAIYNKHRGNGYRNEKGELFVRDENGNHTRITGEWVRKIVAANSWNSPKEALLNHEYDELRNADLLRLNDFGQQDSYDRADKLVRRESKIGRRGQIFLEGARYILGARFEGKTLIKLQDGLYGIGEEVGGVLKITHWFDTLPAEEIIKRRQAIQERMERGEIKKQKTPAAHVTIRVNEIKIKEYRPSEFSIKREDETPEQYADRLHAVGNYENLSNLSDELTEVAGIGLHNLSIREQQWLTAYAGSSDKRYKKIIEFAKAFGIDGLKSFLVCEYGGLLGDKLIETTQKIEKSEVDELFEKYIKLIRKADLIKEFFAKLDFSELSPELLEILPQEMQEAVLRRSKDLLFSVAELLADGGIDQEKKEQAFEAIEALSDFLDIIVSLADKENGKRYEYTKEGNCNQQSSSNIFKVYDRERKAIYRLKTFVRSEADQDGQARVNFELIYDTIAPDEKRQKIFNQEIVYSASDPQKTKISNVSSLRLGIDLETAGDEPAVSLDVGRASYSGENLRRSGDVIGNLLAKYDKQSGNHSTASFKTELARPDNFAKIASRFSGWLSELK